MPAEQDRRQAFLQELTQLAQRYGVTVSAALQVEQLNTTVTQTRAVLVIDTTPNWEPLTGELGHPVSTA